jgi:hypothetical protein
MATTQKHIVKLSWDQATQQRVLTIDGRPVPGVHRVSVDSRAHDCEITISLDQADFELEVGTQSIDLEQYTGG